jgi:hypothetical protein
MLSPRLASFSPSLRSPVAPDYHARVDWGSSDSARIKPPSRGCASRMRCSRLLCRRSNSCCADPPATPNSIRPGSVDGGVAAVFAGTGSAQGRHQTARVSQAACSPAASADPQPQVPGRRSVITFSEVLAAGLGTSIEMAAFNRRPPSCRLPVKSGSEGALSQGRRDLNRNASSGISRASRSDHSWPDLARVSCDHRPLDPSPVAVPSDVQATTVITHLAPASQRRAEVVRNVAYWPRR